MADNRDEVAMPARLDTQHAKSGLGTVECHPLDDAGEHFSVGLRGGRRHGHGQDYPMRPVGGERSQGWSCSLGLEAKGSEASTPAKMEAKGYQPSVYAIRLGS